MQILVISASLNPNSRSFKLARLAWQMFNEPKAEFIDLRDFSLPVCDGDTVFKNTQVTTLKQIIKQARALLLVTPIYNYDVNAALKNLFDLTTSAWENKLIGLIAVAGGRHSYMAPLKFLNSLMLNARCLIVPRYVYALEEEVAQPETLQNKIQNRVQELVQTLCDLNQKLNAAF